MDLPALIFPEVMWRLNKDALSLNEYATWPHEEDVEGGYNMAVKYIAADEVELPLLRDLVVRGRVLRCCA